MSPVNSRSAPALPDFSFRPDAPLHPAAEPYRDAVLASARRHNLDPALVSAVLFNESGGDPNAVSHVGAKGLMQLMDKGAIAQIRQMRGLPETWEPRTPEENIDVGTEYLRYLLKQFDGDPINALGAYNAGEGTIRKYGVERSSAARTYVGKIQNAYRMLHSSASAAEPGPGATPALNIFAKPSGNLWEQYQQEVAAGMPGGMPGAPGAPGAPAPGAPAPPTRNGMPPLPSAASVGESRGWAPGSTFAREVAPWSSRNSLTIPMPKFLGGNIPLPDLENTRFPSLAARGLGLPGTWDEAKQVASGLMQAVKTASTPRDATEEAIAKVTTLGVPFNPSIAAPALLAKRAIEDPKKALEMGKGLATGVLGVGGPGMEAAVERYYDDPRLGTALPMWGSALVPFGGSAAHATGMSADRGDPLGVPAGTSGSTAGLLMFHPGAQIVAGKGMVAAGERVRASSTGSYTRAVGGLLRGKDINAPWLARTWEAMVENAGRTLQTHGYRKIAWGRAALTKELTGLWHGSRTENGKVIRDSLKVDLNREAENLANGVAAGTPGSQLISPQDVQDAWRAFYGEVESTMKEPGRMAFFRREMDQRAGVTDLMLDPELPKKRALAAQEAFEQAQVNKVRSQVAAGEIPAPQPDKFWADLRKESAKVYRKELEGFKPTLVGYRPDAMFDIYAGNLDEFHNAGADRIFRKLGFEGKGDSSTRIDDLTARAFTNIVVERTTLGRLSDDAAAALDDMRGWYDASMAARYASDSAGVVRRAMNRVQYDPGLRAGMFAALSTLKSPQGAIGAGALMSSMLGAPALTAGALAFGYAAIRRAAGPRLLSAITKNKFAGFLEGTGQHLIEYGLKRKAAGTAIGGAGAKSVGASAATAETGAGGAGAGGSRWGEWSSGPGGVGATSGTGTRAPGSVGASALNDLEAGYAPPDIPLTPPPTRTGAAPAQLAAPDEPRGLLAAPSSEPPALGPAPPPARFQGGSGGTAGLPGEGPGAGMGMIDTQPPPGQGIVGGDIIAHSFNTLDREEWGRTVKDFLDRNRDPEAPGRVPDRQHMAEGKRGVGELEDAPPVPEGEEALPNFNVFDINRNRVLLEGFYDEAYPELMKEIEQIADYRTRVLLQNGEQPLPRGRMIDQVVTELESELAGRGGAPPDVALPLAARPPATPPGTPPGTPPPSGGASTSSSGAGASSLPGGEAPQSQAASLTSEAPGVPPRTPPPGGSQGGGGGVPRGASAGVPPPTQIGSAQTVMSPGAFTGEIPPAPAPAPAAKSAAKGTAKTKAKGKGRTETETVAIQPTPPPTKTSAAPVAAPPPRQPRWWGPEEPEPEPVPVAPAAEPVAPVAPAAPAAPVAATPAATPAVKAVATEEATPVSSTASTPEAPAATTATPAAPTPAAAAPAPAAPTPTPAPAAAAPDVPSLKPDLPVRGYRGKWVHRTDLDNDNEVLGGMEDIKTAPDADAAADFGSVTHDYSGPLAITMYPTAKHGSFAGSVKHTFWGPNSKPRSSATPERLTIHPKKAYVLETMDEVNLLQQEAYRQALRDKGYDAVIVRRAQGVSRDKKSGAVLSTPVYDEPLGVILDEGLLNPNAVPNASTASKVAAGGPPPRRPFDVQPGPFASFAANPLDPKELIASDPDGMIYGAFRATPHLDGYQLQGLRATETGKGYGDAMMGQITRAADKNGTKLYINAKPFGVGGMAQSELEAWYRKWGFSQTDDAPAGSMVRPSSPVAPQPPPPLPLRAQLPDHLKKRYTESDAPPSTKRRALESELKRVREEHARISKEYGSHAAALDEALSPTVVNADERILSEIHRIGGLGFDDPFWGRELTDLVGNRSRRKYFSKKGQSIEAVLQHLQGEELIEEMTSRDFLDILGDIFRRRDFKELAAPPTRRGGKAAPPAPPPVLDEAGYAAAADKLGELSDRMKELEDELADLLNEDTPPF